MEAGERFVPRWISVSTLALSIVAVGITTYLTYTHYTDPSALACPDTGAINCLKVTTSSWSMILGIPVAVLGLVWAVPMAALSLPWAWHSDNRWIDTARLALAVAGAAMVLYLVYVELFEIGAICLWCTGVHVTAVALFAVIWFGRASMVSAQMGTAAR